MASSSPSTFHCSLPFTFSSRTPPLSFPRVSITPPLSTNKTPLNLSSSHTISTVAPLVLSRVPSPPQKASHPFTVVCAKGYKMKTHKVICWNSEALLKFWVVVWKWVYEFWDFQASAKRFRVSGSGKIMRRRAGKQHLLRKKNTKRRLRLSKTVCPLSSLNFYSLFCCRIIGFIGSDEFRLKSIYTYITVMSIAV